MDYLHKTDGEVVTSGLIDAAGQPFVVVSAAAARLAATGMSLFGQRFQATLAKELDVSRPLLWAMLNGSRRITPDIERRLAALIRDRQIPRLHETIRTLELIVEAIDVKLDVYSRLPTEARSDPRKPDIKDASR